MTLSAARVVATRAASRKAPLQQQKRGIVDYLTNYPDKVSTLFDGLSGVDSGRQRNPDIHNRCEED